MAWFNNHYDHCGQSWSSEWSCTCNDECPVCNREIEPEESDDLTLVVEVNTDGSGTFNVIRSPDTAEDDPDYEIVAGPFPTQAAAQAALNREMETTDVN